MGFKFLQTFFKLLRCEYFGIVIFWWNSNIEGKTNAAIIYRFLNYPFTATVFKKRTEITFLGGGGG